MHFKVLELVLYHIVGMSTTIISQESDARAYRFWVERHNALQHFLDSVRVLCCQRDFAKFTQHNTSVLVKRARQQGRLLKVVWFVSKNLSPYIVQKVIDISLTSSSTVSPLPGTVIDAHCNMCVPYSRGYVAYVSLQDSTFDKTCVRDV